MTDIHRQRDSIRQTAAEMASRLCDGFKYHDRRERDRAVDAFADVDSRQFRYLEPSEARRASEAFVDALWEKDSVENEHLHGDEFDREALADADWSDVEAAFMRRAEIADIDPRYAVESTVAWRNHKTQGDYWTPIQRAQLYEFRAALEDAEYPGKPAYGGAGFGPEPVRYALAVELHDMHTKRHWAQAERVMRPYFERILVGHEQQP